MDIFISLIAKQLQISERQVQNTVKLLGEGATIPFISRYRKELTSGLDEVQIGAIADLQAKLTELAKRKETILNTIEEQGKLTPELKQQIEQTWESTVLEDLYLPYKPKRRTRGQMACEKGLEPLAKLLMAQRYSDIDLQAERFLSDAVTSIKDALAGARDIMAEWINENGYARNTIRAIFSREAIIYSRLVKGKEAEGDKFRDYFNAEEPLRRISSHRLLAMRRGEAEGFLKVEIAVSEELCLERLNKLFVTVNNASSEQVKLAVADSYKRLLKPAIETEFAAESKAKADGEAIAIFVENLKQLLLSSPLGQKRVLSLDPGFRTGCKVVCLDAQGNLLHNETIYPHPPKNETALAMKKIAHLVEQYAIEAIAIGNGTAGRETEQFIQSIHFDRQVQVFVVSENGASIYSASKIAREEFPEYDVTVRGAVSLGRRLMDPLAELVKLDPKSIGVGQYQYDVDQSALKKALDQTVENAVNKVGVNVNTASKYLLTYISGIGPQLAENIVAFRAQNGPFKSRKALLNVAKMGAKSFEQSAGFMRVENSDNPLDNSAVHPESYPIVERMARDLKCSVADLLRDENLRKQILVQNYVTDTVGLPTLNDVLLELAKPGRDPRTEIQVFAFDPTVKTINDVKVGQILPGIITNVTKFGAFVDVGVHENGLVHISNMADRFVSDPTEVVALHQHVQVKVIEVDLERKRIQLSMKGIKQ
ncbi:MAG: RNA-binding transcriptional accessory protein [Prevotellaceae bacterium]|nr:RNA-binding transcriptional accessory protein [Prevotellaceae bacterium]